MKRLLIAGVAAAAVIAGTSAMAQDEAPPSPMEKTTTTTTTTWSVGPEERTVIHNYVVKERPEPIKEDVAIGAPVPDDVELQPVPEEVYARVPEARRYQYFDWDGRMVFVDPDSRRVVQIVD